MVGATFTGLAYRQCHPDHADLEATLRASQSFSFRFNRENEFGALYVALDRATAVADLVRRARLSSTPVQAYAPRVLLTLRVELRKVLDLTDPAIRRQWDIALEDLQADDYLRCQEVAQVARRQGYEAIRYPSATGEGENLAIFLDRLQPESEVTIQEQEELPLDSL
ncbi:hypothetical protein BH23GEM7_BH23GEM7_11310 [soil metagenome]